MTDNNAILFELQKNLEDLSSAKTQMEEFRSVSKNVVQGVNGIQTRMDTYLKEIETDYKKRAGQLEESVNRFLSEQEKQSKTSIKKVLGDSERVMQTAGAKFVVISDDIQKSNEGKLKAISELLEHYKQVVGASSSLIETLKAIDFPTKLDVLTTKSQLIIESITNSKQALEIKSSETLNTLLDKSNLIKDQINEHTAHRSKVLLEKVEGSIQHQNNAFKERFTQISQNMIAQEKKIKTLQTLAFGSMILTVIAAIAIILILKTP